MDGRNGVEITSMKATDDFSRYDDEHVEGLYECLDRIVINAYFPTGQTGGGMRYGWRKLKGNGRIDE